MMRNQSNNLNGRSFLNKGFTLVELMVVISVIVILAAITIMGYSSWREHIAETEVKNDLVNLKASMEDVRNRTNVYPSYTPGTNFDGTNSTKIVFTQSKNVTLTYSSGDDDTYCVTGQSTERSSVTLFINMASSDKNPQAGSC